MGELRRRLHSGLQAALRFNPDRRRVSAKDDAPPTDASKPKDRPPRAPRVEERAHARAVLAALEARGVRIEWLSGKALEQRLPFSTRRAA